ncbi:ankyrin repeat domain-containing protein [Candidatus Palauibacter sp.]|uniref:ankyrin repeat domain-containing protein n=1 Tax=Candidatus Palauibacter sp. TaxID=3101350 RepID=UPI003B5BD6B0
MRPAALALLLATALSAGVVAQEGPPVAGHRLLDAAQGGEAEVVRALAREGADVSAARGDGITALHLAAERGHAGVVRVLIDAGAAVEAGTRIGRYTPLHLAGRGGHGEVVALLLGAGADPNAATTNSGVTALHLAAAAVEGTGAVTALLDHGADPDVREASAGQTPLMFAAAANRAASAAALLEGGADPGLATAVVDVLPSLALDREANRRFRDWIGAPAETIGPYGPEVDPEAEWPGEPGPARVQAAIRAQREFLRSGFDVGAVSAHSLARVGPDYPGGPDVVRPPYREVLVGKTGGMTALLHAVREGHIDAARTLLDGGADIDRASADATSPLLMATLNGQFDLALVLIERGADPDPAASTDGATPLFAVLQTQWAPKSNYPQPRAQDLQQAGHMDVLRALLEAGADPNPRLNTHLWHWEYGLTKMGIDLTGATPFWRAAFAQDLDAMKLLVAHGADPHIPTSWPEVGMRERRQQDGRQQEDSALPWIPGGAPNASPVHAAAGGGYLGLGAFSVRNRPNQFIPVVKYLVEELGADVNQRDSWLYTPMHYAASRGDNELIEYLVSRGGEVTAITRLGQSTADMARGGRAGFFTRVPYPETVELLTSLGATLECLHTHFLDTGDSCPGAGVDDPWAPRATSEDSKTGTGGNR